MKENYHLSVIMSMSIKSIFLAVIVCVLLLPQHSQAAYEGEMAGWIPWWSDTEGIKSATKHLDQLDTVYPFVYEVDAAGKILDRADLNESQWKKFQKAAKKKKVAFIPTVAWFNGTQIDTVLSDRKTRKALVKDITNEVKKHGFDGINIDFEDKDAETIDDFSRFLNELNKALGNKMLTCAIEARTPAQDLYKVVPNPLTYANDYEAINKACDRIEIMTYDQQRADLTLNEQRKGLPYAPVADKVWVEKVINLALKDFDADKVVVGVATYGRAWDITVAPDSYRDYKSVAALNQPRILELSKIYSSGIGRSAGGEAVISYFPEDSPYKLFSALPVPTGTPAGFEAAARALLVANMAKVEVPVRFVTWSDAVAIQDKLNLVDQYNLRGAALFKIDGEEDPKIWDLF